jgi:hypothetical protein
MADWEKKYSVANLFKELDTNEPQDLYNYLRMNTELFRNLLSLIRLRIEKNTTLMRDGESAEARIAVTVCCSPPVARFSTRGVIAQPTGGSLHYHRMTRVAGTGPLKQQQDMK